MSSNHEQKGTLGVSDDGAFRLQFTRHFSISVAETWNWIVQPEKLQRWLPGCHIDATVGGKVLFDFGDEGQASGLVSALVAPGGQAELVHSWNWPGLPESVVRWTLTPHGDGTELVLVHSEVSPEPAVDFAIGWHVMLDALGLAADGNSPKEAWEQLETIASWYQQ